MVWELIKSPRQFILSHIQRNGTLYLLNALWVLCKHETDSLVAVRNEIGDLQNTIFNVTLPPHLIPLQQDIEQNIWKIENHIVEIKQSKFRRDTQDYEKGEVYTQLKFNNTAPYPCSILKKTYKSKYYLSIANHPIIQIMPHQRIFLIIWGRNNVVTKRPTTEYQQAV